MDITPADIRAATFKSSRKGYDIDEVHAYLAEVAKAVEECQQHATSMEARARAAVSRLQEYQAQATAEIDVAAPGGPPEVAVAAAPPAVEVSTDEAETISRTLVLAQRTADATVADARAEADRLRSEARAEAESTLDSTRELSAKLIEDARTEARQASSAEREQAENEVEALKARREFLVGDVDQLETFLVDQRERLRGAARQIEALCERVPAGLGDVRRPPLSAASDGDEITGEVPVVADGPLADEASELFRTPGAAAPFAGADGAVDPDATSEMPMAVTDSDSPTLPIPGGQGST